MGRQAVNRQDPMFLKIEPAVKLHFMKLVLLCVFSLIAVQCMAQFQEAKEIDALELKTRMMNKLLIRYEKADTADENGRHFEVTRSYYFDSNRENLLLITAFENQFLPHMGLQIWYTFSNNKLVKVRAMPSKMVCRKCTAEYYFWNDRFVRKNEQNFAVQNVLSLLDDSKRLSSKVLHKAH